METRNKKLKTFSQEISEIRNENSRKAGAPLGAIRFDKNLIGRKIGMLTCVDFSHTVDRDAWFIFECACGANRTFKGKSVKQFATKTCGTVECKRNLKATTKKGVLSGSGQEQVNR